MGIAGRSWETGTEPRGCLGGKKTLSSHKDTPRGAEGNKYPFFSDTLPPSQLGRYLEATRSPRLPATETRRAGWPELHNSKHLSRTQRSEKARARLDLSVSSFIPTTQAQNHPILSVRHLGTALPPFPPSGGAKMADLPCSLCFSKITCCRSAKAHTLPFTWGKGQRLVPHSKATHGHTIPSFMWKAQRKARTEMGREKEAQGLGMPHTASPTTTWPSFAPLHLKRGKVLGKKKHRA